MPVPDHIHIEIIAVTGSAPREVWANMLVTAEGITGTIGGGALEWQAMDVARGLLLGDVQQVDRTIALGPEIGQCCGGQVTLRFTRNKPLLVGDNPFVYVFGAGHTGRALTQLLASQPFRTVLIDERPEAVIDLPDNIQTEVTPLPEALINAAPPASAFVVMTHDHGLDFQIAEAALARGDAAYVGLIGSASKRAAFLNHLARSGTEISADALVCPIGATGRGDKRPQVVAAFTLTELLMAFR